MTTHAIPVRLDLDRYATGFGRAMAHLDKAATKELDAANIDPLLRELVRVRASQINGCAYCVDMHTRDARAAGETEQRLHAVAVWLEAPFFTDRERAALAFTESVTRRGQHPRARRGLRRRRRRVRARGGGRAPQPDRRDQRLERAVGRVPVLGARGARIGGVTTFRELHRPGSPLVMPNPWDVGSARVLATLGFAALATTSSGFAATLGKLDGEVGRDAAVAHAAELAGAVPVPVSADLENGFADDPAGVAATVEAAAATPLAGCSIEDRGPEGGYPADLAVERVAAAAKAKGGLVLTARAEAFLYPDADLAEVVARLQRFVEVGADVVYAPGLARPADIATVVREVDVPVNVLLRPGGPTVAELADLGVARISVGGAFAFACLGALEKAARGLLDGELPPWDDVAAGAKLARRAFGS